MESYDMSEKPVEEDATPYLVYPILANKVTFSHTIVSPHYDPGKKTVFLPYCEEDNSYREDISHTMNVIYRSCETLPIVAAIDGTNSQVPTLNMMDCKNVNKKMMEILIQHYETRLGMDTSEKPQGYMIYNMVFESGEILDGNVILNIILRAPGDWGSHYAFKRACESELASLTTISFQDSQYIAGVGRYG